MDRMCLQNKQGIVLIVTLWVIVLLSTVALAYVRQVNMELKMVAFQRDTEIVDSAARAGLRQALILLREDRIKDSGELFQETMFRFNNDDMYQYDGGTDWWAYNPEYYEEVPFYQKGNHTAYYYVEVEDEASNFPINNLGTSLDMVSHLLKILGSDENEANSLASAIIDWRDPDRTPTVAEGSHGRGGGGGRGDAEDEMSYYNPGRRRRDGGIPDVIIKNAAFGSVDELLLVPGMTPAILYGTVDPDEGGGRSRRRASRNGAYLGLANYITTHAQNVNLNTVKEEVLESILYGVLGDDADRMASEWTDYRDGSDGETYTRDDRVMKTVDNTDMDSVHITNVNGFTPQLLQQLGRFLSISSEVFEVRSLADYQGIEKGYRAIVERHFRGFEDLPQYGFDTFNLEDLEQVKIQIKLFEPLFDAQKRIERFG